MARLSRPSLSPEGISLISSSSSCETGERARLSPLKTSFECKFLLDTPAPQLIRSAEKIKEDYTYVCQDIVKEFKKYDGDPYRYFARFQGEHSVTGRVSLLVPYVELG